MDLIIRNRVIRTGIDVILTKLKYDINGKYLKYIGAVKGNDLKITCPWHKDGQESHPSCHVFCDYADPKIYYGTVHCFTCGKQVPLYTMVGHCLDGDDETGKNWLVDNFGDTFYEEGLLLEEIDFNKKEKRNQYMDEAVLSLYNTYHPYMTQRKLSLPIIRTFKIGYDKEADAITFPVWDVNNHLLFITRRCVNKKMFIIPENVEKPVYLLNFVVGRNLPYVVICESQINALYAWSLGIPAVALFGTGTELQYELLKKSGVRNFVLAFDGDDAGRNATNRFKENFKNDCIITVLDIPRGEDLNDLDEKYVNFLMNSNGLYERFYIS